MNKSHAFLIWAYTEYGAGRLNDRCADRILESAIALEKGFFAKVRSEYINPKNGAPPYEVIWDCEYGLPLSDPTGE